MLALKDASYQAKRRPYSGTWLRVSVGSETKSDTNIDDTNALEHNIKLVNTLDKQSKTDDNDNETNEKQVNSELSLDNDDEKEFDAHSAAGWLMPLNSKLEQQPELYATLANGIITLHKGGAREFACEAFLNSPSRDIGKNKCFLLLLFISYLFLYNSF